MRKDAKPVLAAVVLRSGLRIPSINPSSDMRILLKAA